MPLLSCGNHRVYLKVRPEQALLAPLSSPSLTLNSPSLILGGTEVQTNRSVLLRNLLHSSPSYRASPTWH